MWICREIHPRFPKTLTRIKKTKNIHSIRYFQTVKLLFSSTFFKIALYHFKQATKWMPWDLILPPLVVISDDEDEQLVGYNYPPQYSARLHRGSRSTASLTCQCIGPTNSSHNLTHDHRLRLGQRSRRWLLVRVGRRGGLRRTRHPADGNSRGSGTWWPKFCYTFRTWRGHHCCFLYLKYPPQGTISS